MRRFVTHISALLFVGLLLLGGGGHVAQAQTGPGGVGNASGSGSQPADTLWLKANEGVTTSNGTVSTWADQSGNGNDLSQGTSSARPEFQSSISGIDGQPGLRFDGEDDFLESSTNGLMEGLSGFDVFLVSKIRPEDSDNFARVLAEKGGKNGKVYNFGVNDLSSTPQRARSIMNMTRGQNAEVLGNETLGSFHLYGHRLEPVGGGKNDLVLEIDGTVPPDGRDGNVGNTITGENAPFRMALNGDGGRYIGADVAETIIYTETLNDAQQLIVENYLSSKYALGLPNGDDKYAYDNTYANEVAGIGQANGDSHTTAYSDLLRVTNPSSLGDGDFLLYGHEGSGTSSWSTTDVPTNDYQRLEREWRFSKTNSPGTITLQVDENELPSLPSGYTKYYALVDTDDGDFSDGTTTRIELSNSSGSIYETTTGVSINDGAYVTYAVGSPAATPQNVAAKSDLNRRTEVTFDEVTTNAAGLSTTLTGDEYNVYLDSKDNGSISIDDTTGLRKGTDYTISISSGTVTVEVTQDRGDDNGQSTTKLDNETTYGLWVTAENEVGESTESSQVTATPALKAFFDTADSFDREKNTSTDITVKLSDSEYSGSISVDVGVSQDDIRSVLIGKISISNGGSGYSDGDIIGDNDANDGDGGKGLRIRVDNTNSGAVDAFTVLNSGSGYEQDPVETFATLQGSGSGAEFNTEFQAAGGDYVQNTTSLSFSSPTTSKTLKVRDVGDSEDFAVDDDELPENSETFQLSLSNVDSPAILGSQSTHDFTIADSDIVRKVFFVDDQDGSEDGATSGDEASSSDEIKIKLSETNPVDDTDVFIEATFDGLSPAAGTSDFTAVSDTVTIPSGTQSISYSYKINDDSQYEQDEKADINIIGATNASPQSDDTKDPSRYTTITHTIVDDENAPTVSITDTGSDDEADRTLFPTVQLSNSSYEDITVDLDTSGTATGGAVDYSFSTSSVTIPAGSTSVTLSPQIKEDNLDENDESLNISLIDPPASGDASIGSPSTFNYTILDDDPKPTVAFDVDASSGLEDQVGPKNIGLSLSEVSGRDVDISYSVGGTATGGGDDYTDQDNGSVTISAGNTSTDISIDVKEDQEGEDDETVDLSFASSDLTNADPGSTTNHTFTIIDDDLGFTGPAGVGSAATNPLWVRADTGVTESGSVTGWADQSGNGNDLGNANGDPQLISSAINSEPAVSFDGSGDFLEFGNTLMEGLDGFNVFVVANIKEAGSDDFARLLSDEKPGGDRVYNLGVTKNTKSVRTIMDLTNAEGAEIKESGGSVDTGFNLYDHSLSSANDGTLALRRDGDRVGDVTSVGKTKSGVTNGPFRVGALAGNDARFIDAEAAEIIVYDTELNTAARTIVENYLVARYNLAYNGFEFFAGEDQSPAFVTDIIGIGEESDGAHGAAKAGGLRLSIDAFSDGDYVMAAHNEPNNRANYADVGGVSGLDVRMDRTWFLNVAGSGSVDMTFDMSEAGLTEKAGDAANYVLLTGGSPSGSWSAAQTGASSVSGDEVTFSGITPTDGNYYTIGTTDPINSPIISGYGRTIAGESGADGTDAGWRYIGVPMKGATIDDLQPPISPERNGFTTHSVAMDYHWSLDDGGSNTVSWTQLDSGEPVPNGRGFLIYLYDDQYYPLDTELPLDVENINGTPGDNNVTVGNGSPGYDTALNTDTTWHLLANPYEQSFDLPSLNLTRDADSDGDDDFQAVVQLWDPSAGSYETKTQGLSDDEVAPWQAFFAERQDFDGGAAETLTFDSAGKTTGASFVGSKSAKTQKSRQIGLQVIAHNENGQEVARDGAAGLFFHSESTERWDSYDATKLAPFARSYVALAPIGADKTDGEKLKALESRPYSPETVMEVPLDLQMKDLDPAELTLSAREWSNIPEEWEVQLVDTKGTTDRADDDTLAFSPDTSYTFSPTGGTSKTTAQVGDEGSDSATEENGPPTVEALDRTSRATTKAKATASSDTTRFILEVTPGSSALPVEMAKLQASTDDGSAVLEWTTASERNNAGFHVEHKRLAAGDTSVSTQSEGWTEKGFVEGTGSTDKPQNYQYRIEKLDYGQHAFRLRQVDRDGSASYSDVVKTDVRLDGEYEISDPYPNPVQDRATLEVTVRESQPVQVEMYDVLGRRVRTVKNEELPGQDTRRLRLRVEDLSSGVYFLRIKGDSFSETRRMTVVR